MEFRIRHINENSLKLSGELNKSSLELFEFVTYQALNKYSNLTLDISKVTTIDKVAIESILTLYKHSLKKEKVLLFYGYGAKDILDEIHYKNIA
ncbi:hypothetical protein [uncultured Tenacibaculum sp.]|uniref:hypothetical protein n=1 Tax=uncultured Tenacibaculum sp. TaxID=174713 RepID=UPI00262DECAA|nr:hypothetical protein [uncultured Tenacibaculum sp.]